MIRRIDDDDDDAEKREPHRTREDEEAGDFLVRTVLSLAGAAWALVKENKAFFAVVFLLVIAFAVWYYHQ